ncbi:MAG: yeaC [Anaerocolumna sp.]|jgi:MoxR-like ATPase|nr:yeaC [Anaerocolumna sp.]
MAYYESVNKIIAEVDKTVIGKKHIIEKVLTAILAKGHILLEDIPGVGKTTLALAFSKTMDLGHNRLQFTPDVLPTDVIGYNLIHKDGSTGDYKAGPVMCNLFLADEINRTSPKTQSALLEVMEEGHVTMDGVTFDVPKPFHVIATQNPIGSIGTQALPESQLDRFMVRLSMGYPDSTSEVNMLKLKKDRKLLAEINTVVQKDELEQMQQEVDKIYIHESIYEYMVGLVLQTRKNQYIELGVSPRGTIALMNMAKATAFINNRDYMIPDDVRNNFKYVVSHRILLKPKAKMSDMSTDEVIDRIIRQVPAPGLS